MADPFLKKLTCCVLIASTLTISSGCSLFVMAGKSLFGDPVITSPFTRASSVKLNEGLHQVVIVATTPETIKGEFPATTIDLIEKVTRQLKANDVKVVNYNTVATWLDDNGGYWDHVDELANAFETDFIVHLEIDSITHKKPYSPDMYEGHIEGTVHGYQVRETRTGKVAHRIFNHPFSRDYPNGYPQLADRMSKDEFHRELMDHASKALAHTLYDHHASEEIY